ncbi:hypothetical protein NQ317_000197 [Molorchus minor]|uniref:Uncharacterized protein n=1 Tax=Molorchus minor TaxID=1323400 RepID=A0ABQ9JEP0_9CUCU|nr:hypothetical protein NQ317_000197 [Molorchus minor]
MSLTIFVSSDQYNMHHQELFPWYSCQVDTAYGDYVSAAEDEITHNPSKFWSFVQSKKGGLYGSSPVTILMSFWFIPKRHLVSLSKGPSIWVFAFLNPGVTCHKFLNSLVRSSFMAETFIEYGTPSMGSGPIGYIADPSLAILSAFTFPRQTQHQKNNETRTKTRVLF